MNLSPVQNGGRFQDRGPQTADRPTEALTTKIGHSTRRPVQGVGYVVPPPSSVSGLPSGRNRGGSPVAPV